MNSAMTLFDGIPSDTATVQVGIVGRSMAIASATTKFRLRPNDRPGIHFCNGCKEYID